MPYLVRMNPKDVCLGMRRRKFADGMTVPQFFNNSMAPIGGVNAYFRHSALTKSPRTLDTYGEGAWELLKWMEDSGLQLDEITDDHVLMYGSALCDYIKPSGSSLEWNTVNDRIGIASRILKWCHENGSAPAYTGNIDVHSGVKREYQSRGHPAQKITTWTPFLTKTEVIEFSKALVLTSHCASLKHRNRLIADAMGEIGLRVSEVANFPIKDLPKLPTEMGDVPCRVIGKGTKARMVLIPYGLLRAIWHYVETDREKSVERANANGVAESPILFLSRSGRPITTNQIQKIFRKASSIFRKRVWPHLKRHTYATHRYLHTGDLVELADRLGHGDISTSRRYVHVAELIHKSAIHSEYQESLDAGT